MSDSFPENQWPTLCERMETDGAKAVVDFIQTFDAPLRITLYHFARKGFAFREWKNKNWDDHAVVCRAGIAEMLAQGEVDEANRLSYNLAADLAPCWPGDDLLRESRHFEIGLEVAEPCISWRQELGKGPDGLAIAHWVKGIHLLALGRAKEASQDFEQCFNYMVRFAEAKGEPTVISANALDDLILNAGYDALGKWRVGQPEGETRYREVLSVFEEKLKREDSNKEDIRFHIGQLEKTRMLFVEG